MRKIAVLCDFDGTIAQEDVGNLLFKTFADRERVMSIVEEWKKGAISSRECLEREASLARVSRADLSQFISERKLDPYFKDFVDFARRVGIEIVIVSDGLDHYIESMLVRHGLGDLDFFSNLLRIVDGELRIDFPHYDKRDCRDCGNCKTYHLERYRQAGYYVVYVGNGLSDRCPSFYSDLVFAKGELAAFCRKSDVNFIEFRNFRDIERELLKRFVFAPDDEALEGGFASEM